MCIFSGLVHNNVHIIDGNYRGIVFNGSLVFGIDGNSQKLITSNNTRLTIAIAGLIISEGLSFNLAQKPRFKKILELESKISKTYITPNINLISKELLDVIHEYNMKRNPEMIKKEAEIFGLVFLVDGATISRCLSFSFGLVTVTKYHAHYWVVFPSPEQRLPSH